MQDSFNFSPDRQRRALLQAGAMGTGAALLGGLPLFGHASALNGLQRHALVIGNSAYQQGPLKNPRNDAKAIGTELEKTGFKVDLLLDKSRADMTAAITAYCQRLAKEKAVGLFYYAGHGVQLAWNNYLVPVDANIDKIDDIPNVTVDLRNLIGGLNQAKNPMNVIILDACRDNPFGTRLPVGNKGLSQFDAPPGSLLAYSTSPGNTASDGEGENGLYTEHLLREIRTPEAKIEDVLKRVRLGVRRKSQGQQVPWETTSLEEDFYFLPPKSVKELSKQEIEKQFEIELAVWEKAKNATTPEPIVDYLVRYPNGRFAQLGSVTLDRILAAQGEKKVEVVSSAANPNSKGSAVIDTNYKVGDSYSVLVRDTMTKVEMRRQTFTVTAITPEGVVINDGAIVLDALGNTVKGLGGRILTPVQYFPAEYSVGLRWESRHRQLRLDGRPDTIEMSFKVVGREKITLPAGTFNAFKVEGRGFFVQAGAAMNIDYWIDPQVCRRPVINEIRSFRGSFVAVAERWELQSFKQG